MAFDFWTFHIVAPIENFKIANKKKKLLKQISIISNLLM